MFFRRLRSGLPLALTGLILVALAFGAGSMALAQSSGGLSSEVRIGGDVSATARGGSASNRIGSSDGGGSRSRTSIGGGVHTDSSGGDAETIIGGDGQSGNTHIGGRVTNLGGHQRTTGNAMITGSVTTLPGARADLGGCGRTTVVGDVTVTRGSLEMGCACAARRNGACCLELFRGFCVLSRVPPNKYGCPPRYVLTGATCRLFSDFAHRVGH